MSNRRVQYYASLSLHAMCLSLDKQDLHNVSDSERNCTDLALFAL